MKRIACYSGGQPVAVPDGWQPIETAPKDGTSLLGWVVFGGDVFIPPFSEASLIRWDEGFQSSVCNRKPGWEKQRIGEVTHWQPLPAAPNSQAKE